MTLSSDEELTNDFIATISELWEVDVENRFPGTREADDLIKMFRCCVLALPFAKFLELTTNLHHDFANAVTYELWPELLGTDGRFEELLQLNPQILLKLVRDGRTIVSSDKLLETGSTRLATIISIHPTVTTTFLLERGREIFSESCSRLRQELFASNPYLLYCLSQTQADLFVTFAENEQEGQELLEMEMLNEVGLPISAEFLEHPHIQCYLNTQNLLRAPGAAEMIETGRQIAEVLEAQYEEIREKILKEQIEINFNYFAGTGKQTLIPGKKVDEDVTVFANRLRPRRQRQAAQGSGSKSTEGTLARVARRARTAVPKKTVARSSSGKKTRRVEEVDTAADSEPLVKKARRTSVHASISPVAALRRSSRFVQQSQKADKAQQLTVEDIAQDAARMAAPITRKAAEPAGNKRKRDVAAVTGVCADNDEDLIAPAPKKIKAVRKHKEHPAVTLVATAASDKNGLHPAPKKRKDVSKKRKRLPDTAEVEAGTDDEGMTQPALKRLRSRKTAAAQSVEPSTVEIPETPGASAYDCVEIQTNRATPAKTCEPRDGDSSALSSALLSPLLVRAKPPVADAKQAQRMFTKHEHNFKQHYVKGYLFSNEPRTLATQQKGATVVGWQDLTADIASIDDWHVYDPSLFSTTSFRPFVPLSGPESVPVIPGYIEHDEILNTHSVLTKALQYQLVSAVAMSRIARLAGLDSTVSVGTQTALNAGATTPTLVSPDNGASTTSSSPIVKGSGNKLRIDVNFWNSSISSPS